MKKVFDFVTKSRFWEYFYLGFLFFVFFTGVTSFLVFKENVAPLLWLNEYKEDVFIILSRIFLIREFLSLIIFLWENKGVSKSNFNYFLKKILLFIVVFLVFYGTKRKTYATYALLVMKANETDFDSVMKSYVYGKGAGIILWIVTYLAGLLTVIDYGRGYTFGMSHYNDAAFTICFFLIAVWYLYGQRKNVAFTIIFLVAALVCYKPINSRTAVVTMVMMAVMLWTVFPYLKSSRKPAWVDKAVEYYPIIMLGIAVILSVIVHFRGELIDYTMDGRFKEIARGYFDRGLKLCADPYSGELDGYILDNTYGNFIYKRGLIFTILALFEFVLSNKRIMKNKDCAMALISLYLFTYGQMEYVVKGELLLVFAIYYFCKSIKKEETD